MVYRWRFPALLALVLGATVFTGVLPPAPLKVTRDYPSYCFDASRNFYLPCMYSSKEYRA